LDEANKVRANEALALMPLAKRWVMIGDLNQLPPVMEEAASTFKVSQPLDELVRDDSFYGWIWDKAQAGSRIMLPRQYRMRESIGVILSLVRSNDRAAIGFLNDPNRVNVAISRAKKLLVIVGDSKTVIGGAPELFGPLFEHCKEEGLVAGVGAVVTACQRVGIRSQVQRLSRPHRGDRRTRRRRRGRVAVEDAANGETAISP